MVSEEEILEFQKNLGSKYLFSNVTWILSRHDLLFQILQPFELKFEVESCHHKNFCADSKILPTTLCKDGVSKEAIDVRHE